MFLCCNWNFEGRVTSNFKRPWRYGVFVAIVGSFSPVEGLFRKTVAIGR